MTCTVCGLFTGNPCRACRTHKRIRELLCGSLLLRDQEEEEAVTILRTAAGALLDLAEIASSILARERAEANPPGFNPGFDSGPGLAPVDPGAGAPSSAPAPKPASTKASRLARLPTPPPAPVRSGPVEPDHPPPSHRGNPEGRRPRAPRRSPNRRPRGTKGVQHRLRGFYYGYSRR